MNKSLLIPKLIDLESQSLDTAVTILEDRGCRVSIDQINWGAKYPYKPLTMVNVGHSAEALYLDFFVRCNFLRAVNYQNNSPVWEDSSMVFVIRPNVGSDFISIYINCIGTIAANRNHADGTVTPFTDDEISQISRLASCGQSPFREVEGLFTWNVAMRLPFSLLGIDYTHAPILLKGNFGKNASGTSQPHFLTWNPVDTPEPVISDPLFFGDMILE